MHYGLFAAGSEVKGRTKMWKIILGLAFMAPPLGALWAVAPGLFYSFVAAMSFLVGGFIVFLELGRRWG